MEIEFNREPDRNNRQPRRPVRRKPKGKFNRLPRKARRVLMVIAGLLAIALVITLIAAPISCASRNAAKSKAAAEATVPATEAAQAVAKPASHQINGIPLIKQDYFKAGCETYACTMLLQGLGYDIDEYAFVDNYLIIRPMSYDENGTMYGPDMDSAFAGDIFTGHGINCPAMAKSMNQFLDTQPKNQHAYAIKGKTLEELCSMYIDRNIPVMTWVTTYMDESYVRFSWIVDYVDENSQHQIGDEVEWRQGEHCMVLIGYTDKEYIFNDSVAGEVVKHDKALAEKRFKEIGQQAVAVETKLF